MGRSRLAPVLLVFWVYGAGVARASEPSRRSAGCGPPGEFWQAAAVFSARVLAIERVKDAARPFADRRRVRMMVIERFAGDVHPDGSKVAVETAANGYRFVKGQEYFIYAAREDGRLTVAASSGTKLLSRAVPELAYGRLVAHGYAPPGVIIGTVRLAPGERGARAQPLPGVTVVIDGAGPRAETTTDPAGRYRIVVSAAGTYTVTANVPETHYTASASRSVALPDSHACAQVDIDVRFNGRVSGRVIDASGKAVAGVTVAHASSDSANVSDARRTLTRGDGTYEIDRVPPGPFVVGVELPGGDGYAVASEGTLDGGERRELAPLVLPGDTKIARLEGVVYRGDGAPAPGARVFLKGSGEGSHVLGAPAVADGGGRFTIALLDGERYCVFAEQAPSTGSSAAPEFSDAVEVSAAPVLAPLRLTIRRRF